MSGETKEARRARYLRDKSKKGLARRCEPVRRLLATRHGSRDERSDVQGIFELVAEEFMGSW